MVCWFLLDNKICQIHRTFSKGFRERFLCFAENETDSNSIFCKNSIKKQCLDFGSPDTLHCKKRLAIYGTKLSLVGNNLIIPGQGEKMPTYFYSVETMTDYLFRRSRGNLSRRNQLQDH
jgi:hypothetical protein